MNVGHITKVITILLSAALFACTSTKSLPNNLTQDQTEILNDLKEEINEYYGFYNGAPRINSGPCGRFANLFHEEWNNRFAEKVSISFIMSADSSECYHVLIKLPDGNYYDGGNGILTSKDLKKGYEQGMYIFDMLEYDFDTLNDMSYGLDRTYEHCANYSDEKTSEIIIKHLEQITVSGNE